MNNSLPSGWQTLCGVDPKLKVTGPEIEHIIDLVMNIFADASKIYRLGLSIEPLPLIDNLAIIRSELLKLKTHG